MTRDEHRAAVRDALASGEAVPSAVVVEYLQSDIADLRQQLTAAVEEKQKYAREEDMVALLAKPDHGEEVALLRRACEELAARVAVLEANRVKVTEGDIGGKRFAFTERVV